MFDIDPKGNFYVGFMADPYIYKFDKDFIPITSFGEQGREMDTHYLSITSIPEIRSKGLPQWQTKGYYNWIEYLEEPGYLLRSYKKSEATASDGLQIYKDGCLIGDIEVPKDFKPVGYLAPYIYSEAISENNLLYCSRIKL